MDALYGSNIFASIFHINGKMYYLGDLVRSAQIDSGLSVTDWNKLTERERDIILVDHFYDLKELLKVESTRQNGVLDSIA
jgi:hypothetical protein